jgi:hypothetical protein
MDCVRDAWQSTIGQGLSKPLSSSDWPDGRLVLMATKGPYSLWGLSLRFVWDIAFLPMSNDSDHVVGQDLALRA